MCINILVVLLFAIQSAIVIYYFILYLIRLLFCHR